jgi:hypothetical protein
VAAIVTILAGCVALLAVGYGVGKRSSAYNVEPIRLPGQVCPAPKTNNIYLDLIKDCHFSGPGCTFVSTHWYAKQVTYNLRRVKYEDRTSSEP